VVVAGVLLVGRPRSWPGRPVQDDTLIVWDFCPRTAVPLLGRRMRLVDVAADDAAAAVVEV
jgi:hypothetical protein